MKRRFRVRRAPVSGKKQNRKNLFLIACIVLTICGIMVYQRISLQAKNAQVRAEYESLQEKQDKLEAEREELEDKKVYMQTKKYIEEVAREKLGLIYPGEIIFEPEEE